VPKQHCSKSVRVLLSSLESKGFTVTTKTKKGTVKIVPPSTINGPVYHTHATESSLHQIRRDFARLYGVEVG
jgi:hypothetical protein